MSDKPTRYGTAVDYALGLLASCAQNDPSLAEPARLAQVEYEQTLKELKASPAKVYAWDNLVAYPIDEFLKKIGPEGGPDIDYREVCMQLLVNIIRAQDVIEDTKNA